MQNASSKQIAVLDKVFAPNYSRWRTWAEQNLLGRDAHRMVTRVWGMTQNDLTPHSRRYDETRAAFEWVREYAKRLGYNPKENS